jgi:hypothetical protein
MTDSILDPPLPLACVRLARGEGAVWDSRRSFVRPMVSWSVRLTRYARLWVLAYPRAMRCMALRRRYRLRFVGRACTFFVPRSLSGFCRRRPDVADRRDGWRRCSDGERTGRERWPQGRCGEISSRTRPRARMSVGASRVAHAADFVAGVLDTHAAAVNVNQEIAATRVVARPSGPCRSAPRCGHPGPGSRAGT